MAGFYLMQKGLLLSILEMLGIDEQKKQIRREVKERKATQASEAYYAASQQIASKLEMLPEFQKAETVLAYWSMAGEVYTHDFVRKWSLSKKILLPCVEGDLMFIKAYSNENLLIAGSLYGIPEPDGPYFTEYSLIDIAIIPGIAFDRSNNRMGRGKAYYDRFLNLVSAYKIGICFEFQLFDEIPADAFDIRMECVITDAD